MVEGRNSYRQFQPTLSYAKEYKTVRDLRKEPAVFLWFQLLTVMFENMTDDRVSIEDMLTYAREQFRDNNTMLQQIEKFGFELSDPQSQFDALRWYAGNTFVSKMMSAALKSEDFIVLHKLRVFIRRLIQTIKDESRTTKELWEETHTLYSGRSLTEGDIDHFKSQEGEIIGVNGFLCTSLNLEVASAYHRDMFFRIHVRHDLQNIHFACIRHCSGMKDENEILFALSSTFRIGKTTYELLPNGTIGWIVDLIATDDGTDIFKTYLSWAQEYYNASYAIIFGHLLIQMGEYTRALDYFDKYCQNEDSVDLLIGKGCAHLKREEPGDLKIAETYLIQALNIVPQPNRTLGTVKLSTNLGALYDRLGNCDEALKKFKEAKELVQHDPVMLAAINNNIGAVYDQRLENYTEAETFYQLALEFYQQYPTHHAYGQTLQNLACMLDTCGEHERARRLYYDAKEIFVRTLPSTHPDVRRLLLNIAISYHCEGQFNNAIKLYMEAKDPSRSDNLVEASRLCHIGEVYREKGLYTLAMIHSQQGLDMRRKIFKPKPEHVDIATALLNISQIHLARGDVKKTADFFYESGDMLKYILNFNGIETSPTLAAMYGCLAQLFLKNGVVEKALMHGQQARVMFEHEKMITEIDYITCLLTVAQAYCQIKKYHEAQTIANEALDIFENHLPVHPAKIQALHCLASIAEAQNDLLKARQYMEVSLKYLQDIKSDEKRLFYTCTHKCAAICHRQGDYTNAYNYLTIWSTPAPTDRNELH